MHSSCKERHHKVIRRYVVDRKNTTSLELGLCEDLIAHTLRDLTAQPLRDGFVSPHPPSSSMLRTLMRGLGCSGLAVSTCVEARSGAVTIHRGDVAIYIVDGGEMHAGDIVFFASSLEWGECAFLTAWRRGSSENGVWKFEVRDDIVQVPVRNLRATAIAYIGDKSAQVLRPPHFGDHD